MRPIWFGAVGVVLGIGWVSGSAAASTTCASADSPASQLICRDDALSQAAAAVDGALAALGETTDAHGRLAIEAQQTLWQSRRNDICPVSAADLDDPVAAKAKAECVLHSLVERAAEIEAQRAARARPVTGTPLTITDATAPRIVAASQRPVALTRPVSVNVLVGRWAKADPINRTPIDDCRNSYFEVTREQAVALIDPRVPGLPIEGRLAATTEFSQGVQMVGSNGQTKAFLRLDAAETPRLDRLTIRLDPPSSFAATFVRCR
ncbi:hypothetical protein [Azospirillum griseum]|uniref:Lysozyme inhibitor LprI N-terminal domain-containing protein n=1 Tax=Azospirillum griseum TaxID=2496639 RepID=A0A431VL88_9PROT|nr:hypothetical protein [Azospirillum griseum]RTR21539.1 hypothetical protein EJ903_09050 [Azospirillum griseum]